MAQEIEALERQGPTKESAPAPQPHPLSLVLLSVRRSRLTEDEFLSRCEHVQTERDLILVSFAVQPPQHLSRTVGSKCKCQRECYECEDYGGRCGYLREVDAEEDCHCGGWSRTCNEYGSVLKDVKTYCGTGG